MMQNPITDTHLGIDSNSDKFSQVRQRAKDDYIFRKAKRNKQEKLPSYKVGERVVLSHYTKGGNKKYVLVEVVDFNSGRFIWDYYGIVLKSTVKDFDRIGRLLAFNNDTWPHFNWSPANVSEDNIKWLN
jgi:hypothetical protein